MIRKNAAERTALLKVHGWTGVDGESKCVEQFQTIRGPDACVTNDASPAALATADKCAYGERGR